MTKKEKRVTVYLSDEQVKRRIIKRSARQIPDTHYHVLAGG